jgi:hypothetical protein
VSITTATAPARPRAQNLADRYRPDFPTTELVGAAAALFDALPRWDGHEGPRARIHIGPGVVAISRRDLARRERSAERAGTARRKEVDQLAQAFARDGEFPEPPEPRSEITEWSHRSRVRMRRRFGELDYEPWLRPGEPPVMVTLTYPGDWAAVAPNGRASKRHLFAFKRAYKRAWGIPPRGIWKLEFQHRGAPHYHILMVPPRGRAMAGFGAGLGFRRWLSVTWASIVAADAAEFDRHLKAGTKVNRREGAGMTDPRRLAAYFLKHGSGRRKEYQHRVPAEWTGPGDGPGRFWGHWQLAPYVAMVELEGAFATAAARAVRRWAAAQGVTREVRAPRTAGGRWRPTTFDVVGLAGAELVTTQPPTRGRRVRRRAVRLRRGAGWVAVNNAPAFAAQLWRALAGVTRGGPAPLTT